MVTSLSDRIRDLLESEGITREEMVRRMNFEDSARCMELIERILEENYCPSTQDEVQQLAQVLDGTVPELNALILWEWLGEKLDDLEMRHEDPRYRLKLRINKNTVRTQSMSGLLTDSEALEELRSMIDEVDREQIEESYFLAHLNTVDGETISLNREGEIRGRIDMRTLAGDEVTEPTNPEEPAVESRE